MPIAFERITGNRIETRGLRHGISCVSAYEPPESVATAMCSGDRRMKGEPKAAVEVRGDEVADSSSSSSIGRNSNSDSDDDGDSGGGEVQSEYKGPLDCLDALEEVLPVKRGISRFYNGKSKSFTNLTDAVAYSSIKEIVKPENAFTRKRKNLIAHSTFWDKNRNFPPRSSTGSTSKRPANSNRSFLVGSSQSENNRNTSSPVFTRPPLHPQSQRSSNNDPSSPPPCLNFPPWRSLSLSDLQGAVVLTPTATATVIEGK